MSKLRFYFGFVLGGLWFLACSGFALIHCVLFPGKDHVQFFARIFCKRMAMELEWDLAVDRPDKFAASIPCVFIANHQSIIDVITYGAVVPPSTVAIGKKSLAWIPLFGWLFSAAGNILIDRENPDRAQRSLDKAADKIRKRRLAVWMMPEGHRNRGGRMLAFKSGAFRLAAAAGVPVVPIVAAPLTSVVDTKARTTQPGTLGFRVLDPIPVRADLSKEALAELAERTRQRMQVAFDEMAGT